MKNVINQTVESISIAELLKYATTGASNPIKILRNSVWARFYEICDAVESDDTTRRMVIDFVTTKKLSKARLTKLRKFLRQQAGIEESHDIESLLEQIKITLSEETNFFPRSLEVLADIVDKFSDAFIQMYNYTPDETMSSPGGVVVKTRRSRKGGEDVEDWEDDKETSDRDERYVHIVRGLCSHVDSYVRYLDARANRAVPGQEHQDQIYDAEISSGRWGAFRRIVLSLKKMRLDATMMKLIEDTHYDTSNDLQNTIEGIDAYSILFQERTEEKKKKDQK